jgi:anhydro-N-acetylmuramic acid kinase
MKKHVIGLMSGTSLDGLDICYAVFNEDNLEQFDIIYAETITYAPNFKKKIRDIYSKSALDLVQLDTDLGIFFGEEVQKFIHKYKLSKIDLISSHGQTIFHNPQKGYTTQIGHGAYINAITKIKTISDFRFQDVALGGQGAPLVPIGDIFLFPEYKYCLNLGGFANISIKNKSSIEAFDIVPTNIVLNYYSQKMGKEYDDNGKIASSGQIYKPLLTALNNIQEYQSMVPKSFGWEMVEQKIIPLIESFSLDIPDILRTYVEHIAIQIASKAGQGKMLVTGGGALNTFLMDRISLLSDSQVVIPEKILINYKEALIFGLLGLLKDMGKINILSEVTGANIDHSSGIIYDAFSI